jgi:hypothetical protein
VSAEARLTFGSEGTIFSGDGPGSGDLERLLFGWYVEPDRRSEAFNDSSTGINLGLWNQAQLEACLTQTLPCSGASFVGW